MKYSINSLRCLFLLFFFSFNQIYAQTDSENYFTLKVMTYNVHHCNPPGSSSIDVDMIANVIRQQNPDVVAIQEVDVLTNRSGKIDEAALLAAKTGLTNYHFGKTMNYNDGQYGVLILSRFPLSDTTTYALPSSDPAKDEPRVLAAANINLPGNKTIRFASTHLEAYHAQTRVMQAKEINRIADETKLPFIIAGDMNAEESSDVIQTLDKKFIRTCQHCENTFWEDGETGAIDYIMYRPANTFITVKHEVIQNKTASDHMPVISVLVY